MCIHVGDGRPIYVPGNAQHVRDAIADSTAAWAEFNSLDDRRIFVRVDRVTAVQDA